MDNNALSSALHPNKPRKTSYFVGQIANQIMAVMIRVARANMVNGEWPEETPSIVLLRWPSTTNILAIFLQVE